MQEQTPREGAARLAPDPVALAHRDRSQWPNISVFELFTRTARRLGERAVLLEANGRVTFAELRHTAECLAGSLQRLGVRAGDVVASQLPTWSEAAAVFLAAARLGAIVHPLLPASRERELRAAWKETRARVLFVPAVFRGWDYADWLGKLRGDLPGLEHVIACRGRAPGWMRTWDALLRESPGIASATPVDPDSLLLLVYTSGSTAAPKGVLHTHNTLAAEVLSLRRAHGIGARDRCLVPSPVAHVSGLVHGILVPAILGTTAALMERWDPHEALHWLERENMTYMAGVPTLLQDLVDVTRNRAPCSLALRLFSCGGAPVSEELIAAARRQMPSCVAKRVYGSTEFPTIATTDAADAAARGGKCEGRAIPPNQMRIVDHHGRVCAPGTEGEVEARGPECFVGYTDSEATAESFTPDGWFRTGDLGVLDREGYLQVTGRRKEVILRKGEKVSAREVEEVLAGCPGVAEVAVLGVPDPRSGERVCAVVRLLPGTALTLAEVCGFLTARGVARWKHPEQLAIVQAMPRTESGKVHRAALRELLRGA